MTRAVRFGEDVSRFATLQLSLTAALCSAPLAFNQPVAITLFSAMLFVWGGWLSWKNGATPHRALLLLAALTGVVLALVNHHTLFGREAGLSLLALLLPLKLLEAREKRDARAVLLLCCFLLTGQLLNSQAIPIGITVVASLVAILSATAAVENREQTTLRSFGVAARMLGAAVPIGVALFVFFPRIEGPLWGLPQDAFSGKTGLSSKMSPGSISQLVESGEIAFRVSFDGAIPPPVDRYWRGPVLTRFDGREWTPEYAGVRTTPAYSLTGPSYRYTLTLEPHNERWLLALDFPGAVAATSGQDVVLFRDDFALASSQRQRVRSRRTFISYPRTMVGLDERRSTLNAALMLPGKNNPQTRALGKQLRQEEPDSARRLDKALAFMRRAGLLYTLHPPLSGADPADEFLFQTRKGFCEHFASAFAILMRAAGVPTRVVTGYQGGEMNPIDGTFVVRQSDAHAWTEVWLEGRGWTRVDPTAASAPRRIDDGIGSSLPEGDALPFMLRHEIPLLQRMRYRLEYIGNAWNQWVLGYNAERQQDLMRRLGMPQTDWRALTALLGASGGAWLLWLLWRSMPRQQRGDALDRAWQRFSKKLAKKGLHRHAWEPASVFARRAATALPLHADAISRIAERFTALRYGKTPPQSTDIAALNASIKQLKP